MQRPDFSKISLTPGVYLFKGADGRALYVGKAKCLRKRLASYFRPEHSLPAKTAAMLEKAESLETISTRTENEALLLEGSLIKKHRPPFNIILRDDKEYVLFRLAADTPYPRLEIVRRLQVLRQRRNGPGRAGGGKSAAKAAHFGPFSSAGAARSTWRTIHRIFPLRRCTDRAMRNRAKPCLYHHLGQCPAPCVLAVSPEEYAENVKKVTLLLKGRSRELMDILRAEMEKASEALLFEKAASLRDQLRAVEKTVEKQAVILDKDQDLDVLGLAQISDGLGLGLVQVREGAVLDGRNFYWPGLALEDAPELFASFILQYYSDAPDLPPRIILPWLPGGSGPGALPEGTGGGAPKDWDGDLDDDFAEGGLKALEEALGQLHGRSVRIAAPSGEAEERLVSIAATNAREGAWKKKTDIGELLARAFKAERNLDRIECVDVSHTGGASTRAGMVVFERGQPEKSLWRGYAFAEGGDDYATLAAWAERRAESGPPWPDLLLIDGGRGQLHAVEKAFAEKGLAGAFTLAAIAKARDEEGHSDRRAGNVSDRIFVPGRSNPLNLKPGSPELLFLQHIRNHAHDFVLGRHRQARSGKALEGELNRIPGFGPALVRQLWEKFDSLRQMAEATDEELLAVPGLGRKRLFALRAHLAVVSAVKK